jgi:hypothetical protein
MKPEKENERIRGRERGRERCKSWKLENRMDWSVRIPHCQKSMTSSIFLMVMADADAVPFLLIFKYLRLL